MRTLEKSWPWLLVSSVLGALVAFQTYAWRTWLREAPLARQSEATQAIAARLVAQEGADVAAYTLPAPPLLTSVVMVCWLVIPGLLWVLARRRSVGTDALHITTLKLWGRFVLLLGFCFVVAAVASAALPAALPWTQQLAWAASYHARTAVYALPFAALLTAIASMPTKPVARAVIGLGVLLLLRLATSLAPASLSTLLPGQLTQSLVRLESRVVARGVVVALVWSATFVFLFPLVINKLRARLVAHKGVVMTATKQGQVVAAVLLAATLSSASPALAYSKPGHFGITDAAWHIMRAAAASRISEAGPPQLAVPPSGVDKKDWDAYLTELTTAHAALGKFPIDVPDASGGACLGLPKSTALTQLRTGVTPGHLAMMDSNQCGVDGSYTTGPLYMSVFPKDDAPFAGTALGFHAKNRDDDLNETRIEALPVVRTAFEAGAAGWTLATASLIAPWVCAYKAIASLLGGSSGNCFDDAKAFAEKGNLIAAISGSIPGVDIPRSEDFIGFWHLINVRESGLTNQFDNNQGMYLVEAGPEMKPGALDFAFTAASVLIGVTVSAKESTGVRRYSVESSADGHPATKHRTDWEWSAHPFAVTPMNPLDNLAYGGYNLSGLGRTERLGWPLHAIGDATVPMHVVASPGWGHQAYEDWVEKHLDILLNNPTCPNDGTDCTKFRNDQIRVELAQAQRVLALSYQWRVFLRTHGIRDLITALGKQTLKKAGGDQISGWAWCDSCSVFFNTGKLWKPATDVLAGAVQALNAWDGKFNPKIANDPVAYYTPFTENIRSLVEDAMGAKIAFLIWASQQK